MNRDEARELASDLTDIIQGLFRSMDGPGWMNGPSWMTIEDAVFQRLVKEIK